MLLMQYSEDDTRDKRTTGTEKKQDRDDKDPRWGLRALYEPNRMCAAIPLPRALCEPTEHLYSA